MEQMIENSYYKAYEKRYKQVHNKNMIWSSNTPTKEVLKIINDNNIKKGNLILDLGCEEGRNAIYLLKKCYNVLAVDYSISAIKKCNELTNFCYKDNFLKFDFIVDDMKLIFKYIYSVAVLHMFITKEHRNKFWSFINKHLKDDGIALVCVLGDGEKEYVTDMRDAFKDTKRVVMNNNVTVNVATTSCRIVNWSNLEKEIMENGLTIKKRWISNDIPEFSSSMCVVVEKARV